MTLAGAVASSTASIGVAHSLVNAPYRAAAVVARAAETLDEIAGGRYTLGSAPLLSGAFGPADEHRGDDGGGEQGDGEGDDGAVETSVEGRTEDGADQR
jgi:alkanesulfonate monooxygenase SsuD/methylene tetrahydromethanopterin reductase-like flavin-dependent oxidoreductase (luciferase family)